MSKMELDEIIGLLKGGKYHCQSGSASYTGDYVVYILYYDSSQEAFVDERYECHPEGGDRLFYEKLLTEDQIRKGFQGRDYAQVMAQLSDHRVF
ncbi:MAG: hypothetical protein AAFU64_05610 [Bacteroidota bacterium]